MMNDFFANSTCSASPIWHKRRAIAPSSKVYTYGTWIQRSKSLYNLETRRVPVGERVSINLDPFDTIECGVLKLT